MDNATFKLIVICVTALFGLLHIVRPAGLYRFILKPVCVSCKHSAFRITLLMSSLSVFAILNPTVFSTSLQDPRCALCRLTGQQSRCRDKTRLGKKWASKCSQTRFWQCQDIGNIWSPTPALTRIKLRSINITNSWSLRQFVAMTHTNPMTNCQDHARRKYMVCMVQNNIYWR